jgi:DNA-binding IclR family transcriptional regulator
MCNVKCLPTKGGIKLIMPKTKQLKPRVAAHQPAKEPSGESRYFSRAVGKAIQMLEILSRSSAPLSLNELTRQTQLTKSSAFRLLQTLETLHYIQRDVNGHYLSSQEKSAGVSTQFVNEFVMAAREPMRKLNMEFGETISMAMLIQNHIEVVHVVESANLIRMSNIVGRILPPHASSMGKVITAWQDAEMRKQLLQSYGLTRFNENTIVDEQSIEEEFELIRSRGYSTDAEESTPGGHCFGMAIFSEPSTAGAALSISMPKSRMPADEAKKQRLIQALKNGAEEIAKKLRKQDQASGKVA